MEQKFSAVEYFIGLYPNAFVDINIKKFHEQFICYQLLITEDIFQAVSETCGLQNEDDVHRIDDLWSYPATLKTSGSNDKDFDLLAKVAQCIMTIPHPNANEERIFSLINKSKTPSRSSLHPG